MWAQSSVLKYTAMVALCGGVLTLVNTWNYAGDQIFLLPLHARCVSWMRGRHAGSAAPLTEEGGT
jgi:hypothetical protein